MTSTGSSQIAPRPEAAIVWIDHSHAQTVVVETGGRVTVDSTGLPGPSEPASENLALLHVVEAINDAPRVLILGEPTMRTALEREYVGLGGPPDRLVEIR